MLKAYKYRLYPNPGQQAMIEKTFGVCRLVYNLALECKIRAWQSARQKLTVIDLINQLPELKQEYPWMGETDSQALQASIRNMDTAFDRFFQGSGFPRFKKKSSRQSFRCPNNTREVDFAKGWITVPRVPRIKAAIDRVFTGQIRSITISRTPTGKYYAAVLVDNQQPLPKKIPVRSVTTIGLDLGIKSFLVGSNGRFFEPNQCLNNSLRRLQCLQRRASRKKKGGHNRKRANLCVARLHERIRNQRADYLHKITTGLIRDNQAETFVVEDLHVAGMLKNRKLSRAIANAGWGEFIRQLTYKCAWYGKNLITIGRFEPSSKRCSACGAIKESLTLSEREWQCAGCGVHHGRDLNAAQSIRQLGLEKYARAGSPGEPVESRRSRRA